MNAFRQAYPLREMRILPANKDELKQMRAEDGMLNLETCRSNQLAAIATVDQAPADREAAENGRFLWVVRSSDAPTALEQCPWGRELETKKIKHSNFTGGAPAHSGGELWIVKDEGVLVNSSSGRYGADSPAELAAFVETLRALGFRAASMGFDLDNPRIPNSIQVGPVEWRDPL
jgi:hypothetical protein